MQLWQQRATDTACARPPAGPLQVSVPLGVPSAGAVFVLAGFLKLLVMCMPFTPIAIQVCRLSIFALGWANTEFAHPPPTYVQMYMAGRADLGY